MAKIVSKKHLSKVSELLDDLELLAARADIQINVNNMVHAIYKLDDDTGDVDLHFDISARNIAGSLIESIRRLLQIHSKE